MSKIQLRQNNFLSLIMSVTRSLNQARKGQRKLFYQNYDDIRTDLSIGYEFGSEKIRPDPQQWSKVVKSAAVQSTVCI